MKVIRLVAISHLLGRLIGDDDQLTLLPGLADDGAKC
jgi:hypothetical protein